MPTIDNGSQRMKRYRFRFVLPGMIAVLVAASLVAFNLQIAAHRSLHVVNGFSMPAEVRLEDGQLVEVPSLGWVTLTVAEGVHDASVTIGGHVWTSGQFTVSSGVLARFFKHPAFVLNAGCGAAVMWEEAVYAKPASANSGTTRLCVGQPFVTFDDVDFLFAPFPQTVKFRDGSPIKKTRVSILPLEAEQIMTAPDNLVSIGDRLTLAEVHLKLNSNDAGLLQAYLKGSQQHGQQRRAREFLAGRDIPAKGF